MKTSVKGGGRRAVSEILAAAWSRRENYIESGKISAFRLYDRTEPILPVAIDVYNGDSAVVHVFEVTELLRELTVALKSRGIMRLHFKDRSRGGHIRLPQEEREGCEVTVRENGLNFCVNLCEYRDTGLFLDHRETRAWIRSKSRGKHVLNTFAYTGSFSVYAAGGGAEKTFSVDISKTYCDWIRKNFELNSMSPEKNWIYKMDALEFFRYAARKKMRFDIIIIDPPTFSRSKTGSFSVQKDHPELINAAVEVLTEEGFILFSNNFSGFRLNSHAVSKKAMVKIKKTIPPDFDGPQIHRSWIIKKRPAESGAT